MNYSDIIDFWFKEIEPKMQWQKDLSFDQLIQERFGVVHQKAGQCELYTWRTSPMGKLAEIIVLDQFSRNIYRDHAMAFAQDSLALALSQQAVAQGDDQSLSSAEKSFLYMPYMHSESLAIHEQAVTLFSAAGLENTLNFELKHKAIIEKFGRYPHRNKILGRDSTNAETAFLQTPGSSF